MNSVLKKCHYDCGEISVPENATPEEILELKKQAAEIQAKCSDINIYQQCKCNLAKFLKEENPKLRKL